MNSNKIEQKSTLMVSVEFSVEFICILKFFYWLNFLAAAKCAEIMDSANKIVQSKVSESIYISRKFDYDWHTVIETHNRRNTVLILLRAHSLLKL